jgi:hypothetical protein
VHAWRSLLGSADVQPALVELDLMPLQIAHLGASQAMSVGHEDHGGIAVTMTADLAGSVHQLLYLALGEIAASNCEAVLGDASATKAFIEVYLRFAIVTVNIIHFFFTVRKVFV